MRRSCFPSCRTAGSIRGRGGSGARRQRGDVRRGCGGAYRIGVSARHRLSRRSHGRGFHLLDGVRLAQFDRERSDVADALTYCNVTTASRRGGATDRMAGNPACRQCVVDRRNRNHFQTGPDRDRGRQSGEAGGRQAAARPPARGERALENVKKCLTDHRPVTRLAWRTAARRSCRYSCCCPQPSRCVSRSSAPAHSSSTDSAVTQTHTTGCGQRSPSSLIAAP